MKTFSPFQKMILAILAMIHYGITVAIVAHLGKFVGYGLILLCCTMSSISIFSIITTKTSQCRLVTMILIPILTLSSNIHKKDLFYVYLFQLFTILFNCIYHLFLYRNITSNLVIPCIISFIDAISFVVIFVFIATTSPYQRNKLLSFNIIFEILLLMFMSMNAFNMLFLIYITFNLPFYKSYLIWKYMYKPAKYTNYQYVIVKSENDTNELLYRFYSEIHALSHHKKWKDINNPNETTELLPNNNHNPHNHNTAILQFMHHHKHSMECWKLQYEFMRLHHVDKKQFIHYFMYRNSNCYGYILSVLYIIFSIISHLFPLIWSIYYFLNNDNVYQYHVYQTLINCCIMILYLIFLVGSVGYGVSNRFDVYWAMKYQWKRRRKYAIETPAVDVIHFHNHLKQTEPIAAYFTSDIGLIIMRYCYGIPKKKCKCYPKKKKLRFLP